MNFRTRRQPAPSAEQLVRLRREAWNPTTRPERLTELLGNLRWGESLDRRVLEGVARNPSTPPEALALVLRHAPQSFCRNPAVPLLALAMPEFCSSLPPEGLSLLLRSPQAPALLVTQARGLSGYWHTSVAEDAALHVSQHPEIPESAWALEIRRYWEAALARVAEPEEHEDLYGFSPGDTLWELAEHALIPRELARAAPLEDPLHRYSYEGFRSRGEAEDGRVMDDARQRPPRGSLERFPEAELLYRHLGGAFSPEAHGGDLAQWAEKHAWLALAAAQHPRLPPAARKRLVGHFHPGVRRLMLRREDLEPELRQHARLGVLKRAVRSYLDRPRNPEFLLGRFVAQLHAPDAVRRPFWRSYAYSPQWQDRLAVAIAIRPRPSGKPPRPRHLLLLERLADDGNVLVRAAARARLRGEQFFW